MQTEQRKERFIKIEEVVHRAGISAKTIYRKMKQGSFPQSITLDGRNVAWLESEIDQWIDDLIQQRNIKQDVQ